MLLLCTSPLLVQCRTVQHGTIRAGDKFLRQVSAVVERQPTPSVRRILGINRVISKWRGQNIQAIVMASGAIRNVPRICWVIEAVGIHLVIEHGLIALIGVDVAGKDEIDPVLEEDGFENILTLCAHSGALVLVRNVPWSVSCDDDPRCLSAIDFGEICAEPRRLSVHDGVERTRVLAF